MSETRAPAPAPTPAPTPASAPATAKHLAPRHQNVLIRPWPKIVFMYPTFICATLFWIISLTRGDEGSTLGVPMLGNIYMVVCCVNMLVFSFDFSRIKSITLLLGIVAVVLAIALVDTRWGIIGGIKDVLGSIDIRMNTQFYGVTSAFLAFVLLLVLVNTRFNYYEVNAREILHHHGYLGDITRMPTGGLRLNKEIYDMFEFLLLRSGRLIFYPSTSREAIVIDNVINVNKIEDRIKDLLSVMAVRVTDDSH